MTALEPEPIAQLAQLAQLAELAELAEPAPRDGSAHGYADGVTDAIVRSSVDGIVAFDREFRYTMWNPAMERICGSPREVALGRVAFEVFPFLVDMGFDVVFRDVLAGESRTVPRKEYVQADGTVIYVDGYYSPLRDVRGNIIGGLGVVRDVTDEVAANEALRATQEQLVLAQKTEAIGQLAGTVAHDFNNLLTVVLGCAELLLRRPSTDGNARCAREIIEAAQRGAALTGQLLTFSRRDVVRPEALGLDTIVGGMTPMLERLLGELFTLRVHAGATGCVRADSSQVEQVLLNLAVNARDAMPSGGPIDLETRTVVVGPGGARSEDWEHVPPGRYALLSVKDEGVGIEPEVRRRIFEPFFTTKEPGRGTGLGLAIVHSVVQQSGGHVLVRSTPGKGSTFLVLLPELDEAPTARSPEPAASLPRGQETILLVENEPALRRLLAEILTDCGYRVLAAAGGAEALRIAEREPGLALVLSDLVMPHMSGRELAARLTARTPALRVLFITGYDPAAREAAYDAPVLRKPFSPADLASRVRETLDDARG